MSVKETLFVACERKRRAFALGEALILIIVVLLAFGGIFSSMAYAMRLRSSSQVDLDSYMAAQAVFEAMEENITKKVRDQSSLEAVASDVIVNSLKGENLAGGNFLLRSVRLGLRFISLTPDGSRVIEMTMKRPLLKPGEYAVSKFSRNFNAISAETVRDNAVKRRKD